MPEICRFYGIVVAMYYRDHSPPHLHARYGGSAASVAIETKDVIDGSLPDRALALVADWARLHRDELLADWERARNGLPLLPIEPLREMLWW